MAEIAEAKSCDDCVEIKKLSFEMKGLEIALQKNKNLAESLRKIQDTMFSESDAVGRTLSERIDMSAEKIDSIKCDLTAFKKEVKEDLSKMKDEMRKNSDGIKREIPKLFEHYVNKLLARVGKWFLLSLFLMIISLIIAWNRPYIVALLDAAKQKIEIEK